MGPVYRSVLCRLCACVCLCAIPTLSSYINPCTSSSDCYPAGFNGSSVPTKYINCSNQKCVCSDCFYATNMYKSCAYLRCWEYDNTAQTCNDLRKDQRTAFLLSVFLAALGAANFYIGQNVLGGLQLGIFVALPVILLFGYYLFLRITFCLFTLTLNILSNLWILVVAMWWVSDLFTFAENLRLSGDGCPLRQSL